MKQLSDITVRVPQRLTVWFIRKVCIFAFKRGYINEWVVITNDMKYQWTFEEEYTDLRIWKRLYRRT
jgi:hypothetical protein